MSSVQATAITTRGKSPEAFRTISEVSEELDVPQKMARMRQWCADATEASKGEGGTRYGFVYVDQESFEKHKPSSFAGLAGAFREYQEG